MGDAMGDDQRIPLHLTPDDSWGDTVELLDPSLRLAVSLIESRDWIQLYERTGIDTTAHAAAEQHLPLHIDLKVALDSDVQRELVNLNLSVPDAYFDEAEHNDRLRSVTARLRLGDEIRVGRATSIRDQIAAVAASPSVRRVSLANALQPSFVGDSLGDIDLPPGRQFGGTRLDGTGVVVGIIDDGCAFAHADFLKAGTNQSRVLYLWDQTSQSTSPKAVGKGWTAPPAGFTYGAELSNNPADPAQQIDAAIARHILPGGAIDADAVYADVGYAMPELAAHGTHVMGIAAGNGQSPMGVEGVAPGADIIFVQLPATAIEAGPAALSLCISDAATYIFRRAAQLNKRAVINISFGGYAGPHDGTSPLESTIDQLLGVADRSVVVAAGNGFESDCHAHARLKPGTRSEPFRWIVHPQDPTLNFLELWYNGDARLDLRLTPPGAAKPLRPVHLGDPRSNITRVTDKKVVGWVDHATDPVNNDNYVAITLRPTIDDDSTLAPAPPGIWTVELENVGRHEASFHAWIERDDAGHASRARRRQSQFHPDDADPRSTLAGLATGLHTIAVGGYNSATQEVCRYSACGPTRPTGGKGPRQKPEICAPAEGDAAGRGILSASSRRAQATRMNGTSASAPHVAGLVALILQHVQNTTRAPIPADLIRDLISQAARAGALKPNRHQQADDARNLKQKQVLPQLTGAGKVDVLATLKRL